MATVAVVGASGLVGTRLCEILCDKLKNHRLVLFANTSVGEKVCYFGKTYRYLDVEKLPQALPDYAMFMANEEVAKRFVPLLTRQGTVCCDNSSAFRMQKGVPLAVPQINGEKIGCAKLIANPNCTTIQVAIVLNALKPLNPTAVTVATYQSVSGAGKEGLTDLDEQRSYGKLKCFPHPIFDNLIPQIGEILPDGTTVEEQKMRNELKKILCSNLAVNSFCVRVPVSVGHGAFVNIKFKDPADREKITQLLKAEKDVILFESSYPMPQNLRQTHCVGVGRISDDGQGGVNLFCVADNLLRGAAYNAYQILEISMKNNGDTL